MNAALAAGLFGLALLDSINPSAIAATIYLMTQPRFAPRAAAYIGAIFVTYLTLGVAVLVGLDIAWAALDTRPGYIVIAVVGAGLLGYAIFAPTPKPRGQKLAGKQLTLPAIAALGVAVTLAESVTAFPYLAALALLSDAHLPVATQALTLVIYNLIFVAPPILLSLAFLILRERARPTFERWGDKLSTGAASAVLWLMGAAGFLLLRHGLTMLGMDLGWFSIPMQG